MRKAEIARKTTETKISVAVDLDGAGRYDVKTGIGFLDHMLEQLSRHSLIDITVRAEGDTHIDLHHTTEDVGIALGQAIGKALGDRKGITRYASIDLPMDEVCTRAAVDVSGRPHLVWQVKFDATEGRRVRHRAVSRILSRARAERRDHAAHRQSLRREQPPHRRDMLQGGGAGVSHCVRDRSAQRRSRALHQGHADRLGSLRCDITPCTPRVASTTRLSEYVFVKDGFSWPAFFLPILWILWHRLWLTLVWYIVFVLVVAWTDRLAGDDIATVVALLGKLLFALRGEQHSAARARGPRLATRSDRVSARTSTRRRRVLRMDGYARQPVDKSAVIARAAYTPEHRPPRCDEPIIGLFPEPER